MTFEMTLTEHLTKAASAYMFYFTADYENEPNMKVAASHVNIITHQLFFKKADSLCPRDHCTAENLRGTLHELALE